MDFSINVNTDANVIMRNRLERHSRSGFPVAIRETLNKSAFDLKMNVMPRQAKRAFIQRTPNFFKANSTVVKATGFNMNTMQSTVGFTSTKLKMGKHNYAVKDLEQQEHGGKIKKKAFIPLKPARSGPQRNVRAKNRLSQLRNIVRPSGVSGKNYQQRFIKSAIFAGRGGLVLGRTKNRMILWRVNSVEKFGSGKLKLTPLYTYQAGRSVNVEKTKFMETASIIVQKKMDTVFYAEAKKRLT